MCLSVLCFCSTRFRPVEKAGERHELPTHSAARSERPHEDALASFSYSRSLPATASNPYAIPSPAQATSASGRRGGSSSGGGGASAANGGDPGAGAFAASQGTAGVAFGASQTGALTQSFGGLSQESAFGLPR